MPIQLTKTMKFLLIAYVGVFLCQIGLDQVLGGSVRALLALVPALVIQKGYIWQLFTYSFLHNDVMHLVLNALVLAFVGSDIEGLWGRKRFLFYYFSCIFMSGIIYLFIQIFSKNPAALMTPMMGSSGGIYGLLVAYGILFSERTMLFMLLFPMKAKHFVWVLGGFELLIVISSGQNTLSSIAHLSGMGTGFVLLWLQAKWAARGRSGGKGGFGKSRRTGHLRIVKDNETSDRDQSNKSGPTWH